MLSEEELIERMAEAIWEANTRKGASWKELLIFDSAKQECTATSTLRITRKQAEAALQALLASLPEPDNNGYTDDGCDISRLYRQLLEMRRL